jgi:hypothetical protein
MKKKPKGPVPSLIGSSNGKPKRIPVKRTSPCSRCESPIEGGGDCVGIPKLGSGFTNYKRYCDECFQAILEKTQLDLNELKCL